MLQKSRSTPDPTLNTTQVKEGEKKKHKKAEFSISSSFPMHCNNKYCQTSHNITVHLLCLPHLHMMLFKHFTILQHPLKPCWWRLVVVGGRGGLVFCKHFEHRAETSHRLIHGFHSMSPSSEDSWMRRSFLSGTYFWLEKMKKKKKKVNPSWTVRDRSGCGPHQAVRAEGQVWCIRSFYEFWLQHLRHSSPMWLTGGGAGGGVSYRRSRCWLEVEGLEGSSRCRTFQKCLKRVCAQTVGEVAFLGFFF